MSKPTKDPKGFDFPQSNSIESLRIFLNPNLNYLNGVNKKGSYSECRIEVHGSQNGITKNQRFSY